MYLKMATIIAHFSLLIVLVPSFYTVKAFALIAILSYDEFKLVVLLKSMYCILETIHFSIVHTKDDISDEYNVHVI